MFAYVCLFALSAVFIYRFGAAALQSRSIDDPAGREQEARAGAIVMPEEGGKCRRLSFDNSTGQIREAGSGSCDQVGIPTGRASLPPGLKGFQDAWRR